MKGIIGTQSAYSSERKNDKGKIEIEYYSRG